jgi:type IV pilus assembly protein PilV
MHKLTPMSTQSSTQKRQRGISLIESLVALVVAALGILGIVGVQMRTLADTQTSVRRAEAILLIEDLSERMKVNPNALNNLTSYTSGFDDTPTLSSCTNSCTPAEQASYDMALWKQTVKANLPLGQASIFLAPGETQGRRQLGVIVSWRENEQKMSDEEKNSLDTTKILVDGKWKAGTDSDNACPENRTCHLQYIPVSARCAPYDNGSDTPLFYCS